MLIIYDKLYKEKEMVIMNKKAQKIAAWSMMLLMIASVAASVLVYFID